MEKRFQQIGMMALSREKDCPLYVKEVSLWIDTENDVLFMSPVIENGYSAAVTEFSIGYEATDRNGKVVEKESAYRIDDCDGMEPGAVFGEDMPITLQEQSVTGGEFYIEEVVFADGYIWQAETVHGSSKEQVEEDPNVTTVETIGGFGPEGAIFKRVPLSKIIAQRLTSQFVTTVIAIVLCVISLSQNIGIAMKSENEMVDLLVSSEEMTDLMISAFDSTDTKDMTEAEYRDHIVKSGVAEFARRIYITFSILLGISILYSVYLTFYLRETRKHLRENVVTDNVLAGTVKRLKTLSIIELVVCIVCSFNLFGLIAGITGISTASLHKRVMKKKQTRSI